MAAAALPLIISGVSTAVGFIAQDQQARAAQKAQDQQARQHNEYMQKNAEIARESYINQMGQARLNQQQQQISTGQQMQQAGLESLQARGSAFASATNTGNSFDAAMRQLDFDAAQYGNRLNQQLAWQSQQMQLEQKGMQAQAQSRINAVQPYIPQPIQRPSLLGAAAQFAGQAAQSPYVQNMF